MTTQTKTQSNSTDFEAWKSREPQQVRTDIMTKCFHLNLHANACSQILWEAGFAVKSSTVEKFFTGRRNYLKAKRAIGIAEQVKTEVNEAIQAELEVPEERLAYPY